MKIARIGDRVGRIMKVLRGRLIQAYPSARLSEEAAMEKAHPVRVLHVAARQEEPADSREKVSVLSTHSFEVQREVAKRTISTAKELMKRVPSGRK
jgi:hypothetical protein